MTTARDVIAKWFREQCLFPDTDEKPYADDLLATLFSAEESVRLELAGRLNPWRPIDEAAVGKWVEACYLGQAPIIVSQTGQGKWINLSSVAMPAPPLWREPILPVPPSEDKAP